MFYRKKSAHKHFEIWPGFVDALATVLMVIIFVLMTFVISQLYLTQALQGKEEHVSSLEKKIGSLRLLLTDQDKMNHNLKLKSQDLDHMVDELSNKLSSINQQFKNQSNALDTTQQDRNRLAKDTLELKNQILKLNSSLDLFESSRSEIEGKIKNLNSVLQNTYEDQLDEIRKHDEQIRKLRETNRVLMIEKTSLEKQKTEVSKNFDLLTHDLTELKQHKELSQFRSEFFDNLIKILGNRTDIRIVGDRFVFESEVLFEKASSDLGADGRKGLDALVSALNEISRKIPSNIAWILRVDGHTDSIPIKNSNFPSNWELSAARSIAVVKYLISKGIPSDRLVAAGFGEHQPIVFGKAEKEHAKNRRIEFKLDQK
ncbi:MAG: hypothetical protein C0432_01550 [Candidatus Puniceispirillum sp.]|nr:hypothetical protein [Candidatus Pelagibacter sp.]MBA4282964.1 hypothetical protein [Candidatus Puniceispirillum sp.]